MLDAYYAQDYAGIIGWSLLLRHIDFCMHICMKICSLWLPIGIGLPLIGLALFYIQVF